jgi:quaternary ammonium compound-resistance protein SugE
MTGAAQLGPWTLLVVAGLLEVVWALGFKYVGDDAHFLLKAGVFVAVILSFVLLIAALRELPAGTAYAVWTGIGATGVAILGMIFFREPVTLARIAFIALIVVGIVGLRLSSGGTQT